MKTETVEYKDGDVTQRGYLAFDDKKSGQRPGVLVMPEAFGLGEHAKKRAEYLAEVGYVKFAGDRYGNGIELTNLPDAMRHAGPLFTDPSKLRKRGRAALDALASFPQTDARRLASIGFCMGGMLSLELARDGAPLRGVVSFHGGVKTQRPAEAGKVKAKILVCTGADDTLITVEEDNGLAAELTKAGADWQIIIYGGAKHSFTNPNSDSLAMPAFGYNGLADVRSRKAMRDFFEEIFAA
jgi:dienelactone hydrolase